MNDTYKTLFKEIAHAVELTAEQALEYEKKNNDERGTYAAGVMRADYSKLYDKMRASDFDFSTLTKKDFAKILVGAIIVAQNLEQRIKNEKVALQGYKIDTIPKLDRIVNETNTDEEAIKLANEIFGD